MMAPPEQALGLEQQLPGANSSQAYDTESFLRRNNRGCKSADFYNWPEQSLDDMDSPLAVQQYIQQLIRKDPSKVDEILELPEGQDLGAWKIEHLRLFCMQLNRLATHLQDCCHPDTCNQMTATEQWIFLCAAHKTPNECPAIDYTRHTLDGAASLLNSNKYFPSRVTIKESSVAKLSSVCRRVYRIFSHAYYHHFPVFDDFERETHLCKRFSKFVSMYDLMSKDSLIVPSDSLGPVQSSTAAPEESNMTSISNGPEPAADAPPKETRQESKASTTPTSATAAPATTTDSTGSSSGSRPNAANDTLIKTGRATEPTFSTATMVKGSTIPQEFTNAPNKTSPATTTTATNSPSSAAISTTTTPTSTSTANTSTETTAILSVEPDQQQRNNPTNTLARKPAQIKSGVKSEA